MQITSKLIEIETTFPVDNEVIEQKMLDMGIKPLRWAIVGVKGNILSVSVACEICDMIL